MIDGWCRRHRHRPVPEQQKTLQRKMRGHCNYCGRPGKYCALSQFYRAARRYWRKWLSRRSWKGTKTWLKFQAFLDRVPLPLPRVGVVPREART